MQQAARPLFSGTKPDQAARRMMLRLCALLLARFRRDQCCVIMSLVTLAARWQHDNFRRIDYSGFVVAC
jgi:hypothetical protein